jgi:hypothetical protein
MTKRECRQEFHDVGAPLQNALACEILWGETTSRAILHSISSDNAFLSSGCEAPIGSSISICVEIAESKKTVFLPARIVVAFEGMTNREGWCGLGVHLTRNSTDYMQVKTLLHRR